MDTQDQDQRQTFLEAYLECALWSSTHTPQHDGENGIEEGEPVPFDDVEAEWSEEALANAKVACESFMDAAGDLLKLRCITAESAGHDLWLTSQGHGTGLWDRGYDYETGRKLSELAKLEALNIYLGDDDLIYLS